MRVKRQHICDLGNIHAWKADTTPTDLQIEVQWQVIARFLHIFPFWVCNSFKSLRACRVFFRGCVLNWEPGTTQKHNPSKRKPWNKDKNVACHWLALSCCDAKTIFNYCVEIGHPPAKTKTTLYEFPDASALPNPKNECNLDVACGVCGQGGWFFGRTQLVDANLMIFCGHMPFYFVHLMPRVLQCF